MSDEIPLVHHDLESALEEMLGEARVLKLRVEYLENSKKEINQLIDENKLLKTECDQLQARFVQAIIDSRAQDDQQNLQRLLDTYKLDLEKLKEALPQRPGEAAATDGGAKPETPQKPNKP